ncbi:hypothetical protein BDV95DRAFT_597221 [Massariosphaeria phaeospora]|uniref:Uncharacterized protein n=1 Tax=Massariosphaeria phaeospora TaxID=100035 RepID=A0A7C8I545_9PLEO|nr:hypothetical protein BDV95DRAFT_597221 [Massariosphaeria phaeospora]
MVHSRRFFFASSAFSLALGHGDSNLLKRAPFEGVGFMKSEEGFGSKVVAVDEYQAQFAPAPLTGKSKNVTEPGLAARSLNLAGRQSCDAGYGYCAIFGGCCPDTQDCCSYGYCINPNDSCCPNGACDPGFDCCGADNCSPPDAECCLDGNYCESGNQCVEILSSGRIVCCTDLECTAAVVSGSTSYVDISTSTFAPIPEVTPPPALTTRIVTFDESYTTWYWTVTWWYFSYYWSTFQAESTVTYTRIYETTTYTTTASDESEASMIFSSLSAELTFTAPSSAQTSLAPLLNVEPSETASPTFSFENLFSTGLDDTVSSTLEESSSSTAATTSALNTTRRPAELGPGFSTASGLFVQCILLGTSVASGVLMLWL